MYASLLQIRCAIIFILIIMMTFVIAKGKAIQFRSDMCGKVGYFLFVFVILKIHKLRLQLNM